MRVVEWTGRLTYGLAVAASVAAVACADREELRTGEACDLTTECAAPLVCRLERCRQECRALRDCPVGLDCVRDERDLGACLTPPEAHCDRASDCPAYLVCRFNRCANTCMDDRDCAPGSQCAADPSGETACRDLSDIECEYNSQCPPELICAVDRRCREQCKTNRDCRDGAQCLVMAPSTLRVCAVAAVGMDAGTDAGQDAGTDAGTDTGVDAGPDSGVDSGVDSGPVDSGVDSGPVDSGVPLTGPALLGSGAWHSCALLAGSLRCWGDNASGQLGNPVSPLSLTAVPVVSPPAPLTAVAAGNLHTCALSGTAVWCWGGNASGQLGLNTTVAEPSPALILAFAATGLAAGTAHTCALTPAETISCWGDDTTGQLGRGTVGGAAALSPAAVPGLAGARQIAARGGHTCARFADGTVQCWGRNSWHQLGRDTGMMPSGLPAVVAGLPPVTQLAAGSTHTCAIDAAGGVWCWGDNSAGQLGDGASLLPLPPPPTAVPVAVASLPARATMVTAGFGHTCALLVTGAVYCWGAAIQGQIGRLGFDSSVPVPVTLPPLARPVLDLVAGLNHTCVRSSVGVWCWGSNSQGQLGIGSTVAFQAAPGQVM